MRSNLLLKRILIIGSVTADGLALTVSQQSSLLFSELYGVYISHAPNNYVCCRLKLISNPLEIQCD